MKDPKRADEKEYEFEFEGVPTKADFYGSDFLPELRRVLESITSWRTNNLLEWGSGLSTLMLADVAAHRGGHLVTLDNDPKYLGAVSKAVPDQSSITALAVDLIGPRNNQSDPELNYTTLPLSFDRDFDFVLIDGRRRLECAFCSLLLTHAESVIVLHDYRRTRYQLVHSFFDTIEAGPQFLVMRPKPELLRALEPSRHETRRLFRNSRQPLTHETGRSADPAQLDRIIQARDATIALLSDQIADLEKKDSLLSAQLSLETKGLNQITRSLGWRLLNRYGHVKYRFLLPVYRLLGLPPYGPKERDKS
jgi:predicted O-methyltransferase YrrM